MSLLTKLSTAFQTAKTPAIQELSEKLASQKKPKAKRKLKPSSTNSRTASIALLKRAIQGGGYKSLTVKSLLAAFGYQKRSEENVQRITSWLKDEGLTIYPKLTLQLKATHPLRIYGFPVEQLGDLFEDTTAPTSSKQNKQSERQLEDYIDQHQHYQQLGLTKVKRQHSPLQTRDRFDFLCEDAQNTLVALELKHAGGGKSAVEQVLRYIGMLKQESPTKAARGILITGVRDMDTAKALHGMTPDQQEQIAWYLYRYDQQTGALDFERVSYAFIAQHLQVVG